ncbi:related to integral membrane protein [Rhynchosporium graminicola]|uniref:Related to integral membrane protein n=1 Tax=Rhynchosporium graminicola TaxID=2792576 RepID=A0A1E1JZR8_9HELO|nr:related to integral membrane protein [Rhynchosporium commune]
MSLAADGITYSAPPPPGHTPNFNQPHEGLDLIVCVGIFVSLAVVTTVIRIYTRTRIISELAADDYLMLLALACSIVLTAFALDLFNYGLGKHLWDVPIDVLYPHFLFNNLIAAIIYCPAAGFSKISILLFYRRIFRSRSFNRNIWILVTFTAAYSLSGMLVNIFSCRPVHGSWELSLATTAVCINRPIFYFSQAGLSIFTDFATLAVPLPFLRALQLPLKQKLGISVVLMMGAFVCVVSIIRLLSLKTLLANMLPEATTPALMWCVIELNTSIIGGNFPTLKPFLKRYLPGLLGTSRGQKSASYIKSGSHNLQTFDKPPYAANGPKAFNRTTVTGMDKKARDDNESEEYIIQRSSHNSETELERTEQLRAGPSNGGMNGAGRITKTVEYSLTTSKFERDQKY